MVTSIKGNDISTFGGNVDVTGNVVTDAPAFSVYLTSNFSHSAGAWTVVPFDAEYFDTNSYYDTSTYRFTPTVEGYYQFNISLGTIHTGTATIIGAGIWKNNGLGNQTHLMASYISHSSGDVKSMSCLTYMNGTTDFINGYVFNNGTSPSVAAAVQETHMSGYLARAV